MAMLRNKLFRYLTLPVVMVSVLSALVSIQMIRQHIIREAQTRVRVDLNSAWAVFDNQLREVETVLKLAAEKQLLVDCSQKGDWSDAELRRRLEMIRVNSSLDFLDVIAPDGRVVLRTVAPYATGDYRNCRPEVASALKGRIVTSRGLFSAKELELEAEGLAERAFIQLEETPHARLTEKKAENRGMVLTSAAPIVKSGAVVGALYGGVLVNRNQKIIDAIHQTVYHNETYKGRALGTATIFLFDCRIATTVRLPNGNRAIGTRVSKRVADRVLDNGEPWVDEAFVVKDWYLTAYEPIHDVGGDTIGMLYTGILKQPFSDIEHSMLGRYLLLLLVGIAVALVLAFMLAGRLARPIRRLADASETMSRGEEVEPVPSDNVCRETETLIEAFNKMTHTLAEREESLRTLNHNYMETLGFVSHELKSPLSSVMNYAYLLRETKLGPLTESQKKAVDVIDRNIKRLVEMARHYLNLSRIERNAMEPARGRVRLRDDVLQPLIESLQADLDERGIRVETRVGPDVELDADANMIREVLENLLGNAIKYGRDGGLIRLKAGREEPGLIRLSVWNEGDGIPAGREGDVFQKFHRAETDAVRRIKGTGLGLFVSKAIVEAHGGRIEARSEPGQWAEFTFTLPRYTGVGDRISGFAPTGEANAKNSMGTEPLIEKVKRKDDR